MRGCLCETCKREVGKEMFARTMLPSAHEHTIASELALKTSNNSEVLQHVILAKKPYERRLRGAARFSTLSWYVNHVNPGLARVSRRSRFFSHLVILWLSVTLTFSIWAHGDGKRTLFFVWRKVLSRTRGFRVSRQAKAQQRVAKPKLT